MILVSVNHLFITEWLFIKQMEQIVLLNKFIPTVSRNKEILTKLSEAPISSKITPIRQRNEETKNLSADQTKKLR